MYEIFEKLLIEFGVTASQVSKSTGISQTTLSNWKKRKNILSPKLLQKIADYFNVSLEYLMTGEERESNDKYYLNNETTIIAQEIFANKDLYNLLNLSKKLSPEQLHSLIELLNSFTTNQ